MLGCNPGWSPPEKHVERIRTHIRRLKGLAKKPFGVNFTIFVMQDKAKALIDMAIEEGVKIAVTTGGSPRLFTKHLKDAGLTVMYVVGNSRQAKVAEDAGVDIVIAEGYEAGGVDSPDELTTMVLVPYVARAVKIPVVAAGGICDGCGFVAAMALGAEGVQMGSRFVATKECHTHEIYKQAVINAIDTDTVITRRNLGLRVRGLRNEYSRQLYEMDRNGATAEKIRDYIGFGMGREGMIEGDTAKGDLQIGQVAGMLTQIVSAADVVRRIIAEATAIMERCNKLHRA